MWVGRRTLISPSPAGSISVRVQAWGDWRRGSRSSSSCGAFRTWRLGQASRSGGLAPFCAGSPRFPSMSDQAARRVENHRLLSQKWRRLIVKRIGRRFVAALRVLLLGTQVSDLVVRVADRPDCAWTCHVEQVPFEGAPDRL